MLDNRDKNGNAILSHIYLLLGCALPIWLNRFYVFNGSSSPSAVLALSGTLSLGVGDSLASIVGKAIGSTKWPNGQKSVQGTIAFVAGLFVSFCFLSNRYTELFVASLLGGTCVTNEGLMEAFSEQNDNLLIPLYLYCVLSILL